MFFFFKQKTAYEVRISDWSSDVCSSDLPFVMGDGAFAKMPNLKRLVDEITGRPAAARALALKERYDHAFKTEMDDEAKRFLFPQNRSEERRVGKESVSTCRSQRSQFNSKIKYTYTLYLIHLTRHT